MSKANGDGVNGDGTAATAAQGVDVCVYCGSSSGRRPRYASIAHELGTSMASRGVGLVYGGGRVGLMGIVADAVLDAGGRARGVIPEHLVQWETAHSDLTSLDIVGSMHERKAKMADMSAGFIVLPGGFGTFDELFEILTWNQLGLIAKPTVVLDVRDDGFAFFDPLFDLVARMQAEGFVDGSATAILQRANSVDEALDRVMSSAPSVEGKLRTLDVTSKRSLR